ncbi:hypothetical protein DVH24_024917 [Malus domestica]|uniref:Uncharacterized protein n=1 Tax=Malus domestica TaxID=3750 RepID=A0A498JN17_MALDO|nr:hypothetical protein DVH24_024917 [Malus domestica]
MAIYDDCRGWSFQRGEGLNLRSSCVFLRGEGRPPLLTLTWLHHWCHPVADPRNKIRRVNHHFIHSSFRYFIKQLEGMYEANFNLQKGSTEGIHAYSPKFEESALKISIDVY